MTYAINGRLFALWFIMVHMHRPCIIVFGLRMSEGEGVCHYHDINSLIVLEVRCYETRTHTVPYIKGTSFVLLSVVSKKCSFSCEESVCVSRDYISACPLNECSKFITCIHTCAQTNVTLKRKCKIAWTGLELESIYGKKVICIFCLVYHSGLDLKLVMFLVWNWKCMLSFRWAIAYESAIKHYWKWEHDTFCQALTCNIQLLNELLNCQTTRMKLWEGIMISVKAFWWQGLSVIVENAFVYGKEVCKTS